MHSVERNGDVRFHCGSNFEHSRFPLNGFHHSCGRNTFIRTKYSWHRWNLHMQNDAIHRNLIKNRKDPQNEGESTQMCGKQNDAK